MLSERKRRVFKQIDQMFSEIKSLSEWLYNNPELPKEEYKSCAKMIEYLSGKGFEIERNVAGLETAFIARYKIGGGGPKIGFLAEYDALPEVGHGCGHNIIAASCAGAAVALSTVLDIPSEIIVFGTPDEEYDGGKIIMAEAGVFKDLDAAIQIHPEPNANYAGGSSTPHQTMVISFHGKAAHTAANPHEGVNALNAVIVTFVGMHAMQQYLKPGSRMPATITHGGGAPNAVPKFAQMRVHVTTLEPDYLHELVSKIENCAKAGEMATGARADIWKGPVYRKLYSSSPLARVCSENLEITGRKLQDPPEPKSASDMGNVSWECPTVYGHISLDVPGIPRHSKEFADATMTEKGFKALLDATKVLAGATVDMLENPEILEEMKKEYDALSKKFFK
jgi:amidohydrolase